MHCSIAHVSLMRPTKLETDHIIYQFDIVIFSDMQISVDPCNYTEIMSQLGPSVKCPVIVQLTFYFAMRNYTFNLTCKNTSVSASKYIIQILCDTTYSIWTAETLVFWPPFIIRVLRFM